MWVINKASPNQNSRPPSSNQQQSKVFTKNLSIASFTPDIVISQGHSKIALLSRSPSKESINGIKQQIQQQYSARHRTLKARFEIITQQRSMHHQSQHLQIKQSHGTNKKAVEVSRDSSNTSGQHIKVAHSLNERAHNGSTIIQSDLQSTTVQSPQGVNSSFEHKWAAQSQKKPFEQFGMGASIVPDKKQPPSTFKLPILGVSPQLGENSSTVIMSSQHSNPQSIYTISGQPSPQQKPHQTLKGMYSDQTKRRAIEKGAEMFAMTIKQKEVEFQEKLMENRLKKLQDEEERTIKKINSTIKRTQQFEVIQEKKEEHRKRLDDYKERKEHSIEDQRTKNFIEQDERKRRIEEIYKTHHTKKKAIKSEVEDILIETRQTVLKQRKREMEYKHHLNSSIRNEINGHLTMRRDQNQTLREQLAEHYRERNDSIKHTIADKLSRIEQMEQKESMLMQKLQTTMKMRVDVGLNYMKMTGMVNSPTAIKKAYLGNSSSGKGSFDLSHVNTYYAQQRSDDKSSAGALSPSRLKAIQDDDEDEGPLMMTTDARKPADEEREPSKMRPSSSSGHQ